jgi:hypothetical protein
MKALIGISGAKIFMDEIKDEWGRKHLFIPDESLDRRFGR